MNQIEGILFDKDGTLIDFNRTWLPVYRKAAQYLGEQAGKTHDVEKLLVSGGWIPEQESWVPDSVLASGTNDQIFEHWASALYRDDFLTDQRIREQYDQLFALKHESYAPVIDNLGSFFSSLAGYGVRLGVATMDTEKSALQTLESMGCATQLDFVCGADSGFGLKPDPGMVHAFCQACGISPERTIMVGDSPRDLNMGRNAGCGLCIGVLTGATGADALAPLADITYDNIAAILTLFDEQT